jgi:hypothetical protein
MIVGVGEKEPVPQVDGVMGAGAVPTSSNARAIAVPRPAALQHNGGRTPSAWGGFQRRSLFGASVAQRIGKIAAAWLGAWKFLRSRRKSQACS